MSLQMICPSSTYLLGPIPVHVPDAVTWKPRWYPGMFLIFPTYLSCLPLVHGHCILLVTWAKNMLIFDSFLLNLPAMLHQRQSLLLLLPQISCNPSVFSISFVITPG